MFGRKKIIYPICPTQELTGRILSVLASAKSPRTIEEIQQSNRYLSRQSMVKLIRVTRSLVEEGRVIELKIKSADEIKNGKKAYALKGDRYNA